MLPRPYPHYYQNVEGWFGEQDARFYIHLVTNFNGLGHFVEVGCYKGRSTSCLAVEIHNQNKDIKIDCVDIWQPNLMYENLDLQQFNTNLAPFKDRITTLQMTSEEASVKYADQSIDMVFIDADHSFNAVRKDIMLWWPKVKKGGVISGHDEVHADVKKAVTYAFDTYHVIGNCWFVIKQ